jgi:uncharacterized HAD superfamily protein
MENITVDFDNTLALYIPESVTESGIVISFNVVPNFKLIDHLKNLKEKGKHRIYIVSFRDQEGKGEIRDFLYENNLRVNGIVATEGKPKIAAIYRLNSVMHFDDDIDTLIECSKMIKGIKPVLIPNENNHKHPLAKKFIQF